MSARRSIGSIFRWPTLIAGITVAGLVAALVSNGPGDIASWILLAVPVAVAWHRTRAREVA